MASTTKKHKSFAERQAFYAEQAQARRETQNMTTVSKRPKTKSGQRRRSEPQSIPVYPCRVYFYQPEEGGPIRIGRAIEGNDQSLKTMREKNGRRAFSLAVIPNANSEREAAIRQEFQQIRTEPGSSYYRPEAELLQLIAREAQEWETPIKLPPPPREPKPKESPKPRAVIPVRVCERCSLEFETKDKDRYCKECRKSVKEEMYQKGYMKALPKQTRIKPENVGASREGDPSPWNENAVRELEGN